MSEEHIRSQAFLDSKQKLDEAISEFQKVNAEEHGDTEPPVVLGWVVICASTSYAQYGKGTNYGWTCPDNQPWYHSVGLVEYAKKSLLET